VRALRVSAIPSILLLVVTRTGDRPRCSIAETGEPLVGLFGVIAILVEGADAADREVPRRLLTSSALHFDSFVESTVCDRFLVFILI